MKVELIATRKQRQWSFSQIASRESRLTETSLALFATHSQFYADLRTHITAKIYDLLPKSGMAEARLSCHTFISGTAATEVPTPSAALLLRRTSARRPRFLHGSKTVVIVSKVWGNDFDRQNFSFLPCDARSAMCGIVTLMLSVRPSVCLSVCLSVVLR